MENGNAGIHGKGKLRGRGGGMRKVSGNGETMKGREHEKGDSTGCIILCIGATYSIYALNNSIAYSD